MTVRVKIDRIDTLECESTYGTITRLVRRARVLNLADTDYKVLMSALTAAGVPEEGALLEGAPSLVLAKRNAKIVNDRIVDVDLTYEHGLNEGQNLDHPPFGVALVEAQVSLAQVPTNLDKDGNTIVLSHTYPADDPDYPSLTKEQGGEIQYFQPQSTIKVQGIKTVTSPWLFSRAIEGTVNSRVWSGGAVGTWLCQTCSWKVHELGASGSFPSNRYYFTFEFQYNPDGWNPTVFFIDDRSGKPPVGLVADFGYKTVQRYPQADFESVMGVRVQGG